MNLLSALENWGESFPVGVRASETTGSGTNIDVFPDRCKIKRRRRRQKPLNRRMLESKRKARETYHRVGRLTVVERVSGRTVDTEHSADLSTADTLDLLLRARHKTCVSHKSDLNHAVAKTRTSMSALCILTSLGTLIFLPVLALKSVMPRLSVPW